MQNTQHRPFGSYLKSTYHPDCLFTSNPNVKLFMFTQKDLNHTFRDFVVGSPPTLFSGNISMTEWSVTLVMPSVTMMMWSIADWKPSQCSHFVWKRHYFTEKGERVIPLFSWWLRPGSVPGHAVVLASSNSCLFQFLLSDLHLDRWFICQNVGCLSASWLHSPSAFPLRFPKCKPLLAKWVAGIFTSCLKDVGQKGVCVMRCFQTQHLTWFIIEGL